MHTKFMIDGIDRLGKSTLVEGIQQQRGYHLVIHYDKPKYLDAYNIIRSTVLKSAYNMALKNYQFDANKQMFKLLEESTSHLIIDRTHLGEMVYAPLYRGYNGDYIYEMEKKLVAARKFSLPSDLKLILLITSNFDMLQDDGLSFDFSKKEDEQKSFIEAFNRSLLPCKVMVDVHDGKGGYRPAADILEEVLSYES